MENHKIKPILTASVMDREFLPDNPLRIIVDNCDRLEGIWFIRVVVVVGHNTFGGDIELELKSYQRYSLEDAQKMFYELLNYYTKKNHGYNMRYVTIKTEKKLGQKTLIKKEYSYEVRS